VDTRSLVALGMVLAVVIVGLLKGAIDGAALKDVVILLSGGIIGFTVPKRDIAKAGAVPHVPPAAVMVLLAGSLLLMFGCATTGTPPSMGCLDVLAPDCDDPTAYPPLAAQLPPWPFPRLMTPLPGGTQ
jgi:hypothetical protein